MCATCIYKPKMGFDIEHLEDQVRDKYPGFFKGYRICHHSTDVCCRGFWQRHKDSFQLGQIAQRLGFVRFVSVDTAKDIQRDTDGRTVNEKKRSTNPKRRNNKDTEQSS